jgi:hypothetical protein
MMGKLYLDAQSILEDSSNLLKRSVGNSLLNEVARGSSYAPKVKPVGRHRTNGERNADFLAQREIYFQCWDAWEASEYRIKVKVTLEEADQFLPADLARPWGC